MIYFNFFFALLQDIVYFLIIYKISEKYIGTYLSAIIAGLIFGLKHLLFPEYTIYSGIMVFLCAVILFPALFLKSRNVWIIFGFHFFWNYIQNSILGISKPEGLTSVLELDINGPTIFTGDASGFEPSIITCFIAMLIGLYFLNNAKREGKIVKPIWMKN
ncbi:MAG: CPBP family intramembrane metalloprotease [bacterium]